MVRTAERYLRQTHARSMHSTSGVCVCCLASNGTNLYGMMMYGRRRLTKQPKLTAIIQLRRLALIGHIMRMDDNADAKRILLASPPADWRRQLGRSRITWLSTIQQDLKHHHLTLPEAADLAQNRPLWRMMSTYGAMQSWVARQKRRRVLFMCQLIEVNKNDFITATVIKEHEMIKVKQSRQNAFSVNFTTVQTA